MTVHPIFDEPEQQEAPVQRPARAAFPLNEIAGALGAISAILGTRVVLLAALVFAFILSQGAQTSHSITANWSLGLFLAMGFCPVVFLATTRRV